MRAFILVFFTALAGTPFAQVTYKTITEKKPHWNVHITYPVFGGNSKVAILASKTAKVRIDKMLAEFHGTTAEIGKEWTPPAPLELEIKTVMAIQRPNLISFHFEWYDYSGGAHPNHGKRPFAFGLANGKPKQLVLSDIAKIQPGVFMEKVVKPILNKEKSKRGGDREFTIERSSYDRFVITPKGIAFFFDPYEIGPYAEGDYEANVLFAKIRSYLSNEGPLKILLKE